jgi:hypothetical protein
MSVFPLEVKSGMSGSIKALCVFAEKHQSTRSYRTSPRNFIADNDFVNVPLYAVSRFPGIF